MDRYGEESEWSESFTVIVSEEKGDDEKDEEDQIRDPFWIMIIIIVIVLILIGIALIRISRRIE